MKLVHVIPLSRGGNKNTLSYYTSKDIPAGTIVTVPLRKKIVHALVVSVQDISSIKSDIKSALYKMKKVEQVVHKSFLLPDFIEACKKASSFFATSTGAVIESLISTTILKKHTSNTEEFPQKEHGEKQEKFLLQTDEEDRLAIYKSIIREEFGKKKSVFFCVPTIQNIEHITSSLERGIEDYSFVLHSKLTSKKLIDTWERAQRKKHPILLIGTSMIFSLPRNDVGTIILERESSSAYKMQRRPFVDIRIFSEFFAETYGARLILGDVFLRTETLYRHKQGDFVELSPLRFRSITTIEQKIINNREKKDSKKAFRIIGDDVLNLLTTAQKENERTFILTARRGLYPITICGDCGDISLCPNCHSPLVLHKEVKGGKKGNLFVCHKCGKKDIAYDLCKKCKSWRLTPLGIGVERVEEELQKHFPKATILRVDRDNAPQKKKVIEIVKKFYASPNAILVGTEMVLPYMGRITNSVISSLDSFFALPEFRISERVFNLLLRLRAQTTKKLFIQTGMNDTSLFEHVIKGNLAAFYKEEIELRKQLRYPPFTVLIKISWQGTRSFIISESEKIKKTFSDYGTQFSPALAAKIRGRYTMNAIIRVESEEWPNAEILKLLHSLPVSFSVNVNPESLL